MGCVYANNSNPCDDGDSCTQTDVCQGGQCTGGDPVVCDDSNVCTNDSCDSGVGCVYTVNSAPCDDGNECTQADTCQGGKCVVSDPVVCDDSNVCTDDSCDSESGCVYTANSAPCDDGVSCTAPDACVDGSCVGVAQDALCDDNLFCNGTESCDSVLDCQPGTPPVTDDGYSCTVDSCDEVADVIRNDPDDTNCDNSLYCDGAESCDPQAEQSDPESGCTDGPDPDSAGAGNGVPGRPLHVSSDSGRGGLARGDRYFRHRAGRDGISGGRNRGSASTTDRCSKAPPRCRGPILDARDVTR